MLLQVTGGSLEESKEALAIAETDGWAIMLMFLAIFLGLILCLGILDWANLNMLFDFCS